MAATTSRRGYGLDTRSDISQSVACLPERIPLGLRVTLWMKSILFSLTDLLCRKLSDRVSARALLRRAQWLAFSQSKLMGTTWR